MRSVRTPLPAQRGVPPGKLMGGKSCRRQTRADRTRRDRWLLLPTAAVRRTACPVCNAKLLEAGALARPDAPPPPTTAGGSGGGRCGAAAAAAAAAAAYLSSPAPDRGAMGAQALQWRSLLRWMRAEAAAMQARGGGTGGSHGAQGGPEAQRGQRWLWGREICWLEQRLAEHS
jgi:hypothetical protein